jgi:hypothetical protein
MQSQPWFHEEPKPKKVTPTDAAEYIKGMREYVEYWQRQLREADKNRK